MKFNKDGHIFTILFTFISTIVLVLPLTLAYVGTKPIADNYWEIQHIVKTLNSMGIETNEKEPTKAREVFEKQLKKFSVGTIATDEKGNKVVKYKNLTQKDFDDLAKDPKSLPVIEVADKDVYKALQDNSYTGNIPVFFYETEVNGEKRYGGDFTGPGLWGSVSLSVGVNSDVSKLYGLRVLFNVETPGLGGRIGEPWFAKQFNNLVIKDKLVFNLSGEHRENGFDSISGATITSTAVKDILNNQANSLLKAFVAQRGGVQ